MDRLEMLCRLKEHTRLEAFFRDCLVSGDPMISYRFGGRIGLDLSADIVADVARPSHDFLWNTDKTSLAYLGRHEYNRVALEANGSLGQRFDIRLLKVPRYLSLTSLNFDFVSIFYALEGELKLQIGSDELTLQEGNAAVLTPFTTYSAIFIDPDNITVNVCIHRDIIVKHLAGLLSDTGLLSDFMGEAVLLRRNANYLTVKAPPDKGISDLILDMLIEQEKRGAYSDRIIASGMGLFLYRLVSDYGSCVTLGRAMSNADRTALDIVKYLREHFAIKSIDDLSRQFLLSSSYISRLLKQRFGKNYSQLLTEIRLDKAKELLSVNRLSVEAVSHMVGYDDPRQFRRVFKESFHVTPSEYRLERAKTD